MEKLTSIQNQLEHLNECMIYYRKNNNEVPFRESKLRHERIPFIGSQSEFIAIIFLLLEFDYIGKDHGLKLPENYLDGLGAVEIRKFKNELKQKNKLSDLFCDNFSIIEIDKKSKEIVTKNPLSNTVSKNLNTSSLSELHDDKLARLRESLEKINSLVNNLIEKRIKN